ncbi:SurA N-terminal domain-containing protein [Candidatus Saccharibacteria bacterium]|nr:SurA N-terminal domain-containing protein [Candidatus Saccharibacteria bacterium]
MSIRRKKEDKKTEQEKVEERREEVLAAGRKFKYPLQWTNHRVVISTILIAFIIIAMLVISGWLALYRLGRTDEFLFKVTKIFPVPVASVDGDNVPFSDYLMLYRSSVTSIERQSSDRFEEGSMDELRAEYKRSALLESEKYTYAAKLAKELNIEVSNEEIAEEFNRHLKIGGVDRSEEGFVKIIQDNFGLDKSEYERMLYLSLLKAKVEMQIDENANSLAQKVESLLSSNNHDYKAVADELGEKINYQETGGLVDNKNIDGGRATEAMKLEPGQSSDKFVSLNGDGYYFVKLIKKTDNEVNFVSIGIPFTVFNKQFDGLRLEDKISEFIEINSPSEDNN